MSYIEDFYKEYIRHPHKYYYVKYNDGITLVKVADTPSFLNSSSYIYKIDEKHLSILHMLNILEELDNYEMAFQNYFNAANEGSENQAVTLVSELIEKIKILHPFFEENITISTWYIKEKVSEYFKKGYDNYIYDIYMAQGKCATSKSIYEGLSDKFKRVLSPIFIFEKRNPSECYGRKSSCQELWTRLQISMKKCEKEPLEKQTYDRINHIVKASSRIEKPKPVRFLKSLYSLRDTLSDYAMVFSEILLNAKGLSPAQAYCLFLHQHPDIKDILDEQTMLMHPSKIFDLYTDNIYHPLENDFIMEYETFDQNTDGIYQKLCDLNVIKAQSDRKTQTELLQKELDILIPAVIKIPLEIREFYYFEQLIYIELLDIVKEKIPIRKCHFAKCKNYFISKKENRRYCDSCTNTKSTYDKTYASAKSPIEQIKSAYYNFFRQKTQKEQFDEWKEKANYLLRQYIRDGKEHDKKSFIIELNQICDELNMKYTGNSKFIS